jgi:hypothetical protein
MTEGPGGGATVQAAKVKTAAGASRVMVRRIGRSLVAVVGKLIDPTPNRCPTVPTLLMPRNYLMAAAIIATLLLD